MGSSTDKHLPLSTAGIEIDVNLVFELYWICNATNKNAPHEAGHLVLQATLNYTANTGIDAFAAASL